MPAPGSPTLKNLYKQAGLDPSMVSGWADQQAGLLGQYGDTLALLQVDRKRARQAFGQQKRDIRTQKQFDLSSAAGAANDRGMLGSSSDVTARQEVISGAAAQKLAARDQFSQALIAGQQQKTTAARDLQLGLSALASQRAAARASAGTEAYLRKIFDHMANQGGGSAPAMGKWVSKLEGAEGIIGLARRIESLRGGNLFDVSELKGFGPVSNVHTGESHYDGTGFDVNTKIKNNTPYERAQLRALYRALKKAGYGHLFEQVIPTEKNVGRRGRHGHYDFERRRWVAEGAQ